MAKVLDLDLHLPRSFSFFTSVNTRFRVVSMFIVKPRVTLYFGLVLIVNAEKSPEALFVLSWSSVFI